MKPKKLRLPSIVHHKASGKDVVFLRCPGGRRQMVYLGDHDSAESRRRYQEVLSQYLAGTPVLPPTRVQAPSTFPTVGQLAASFLLFANIYYRDAEGVLSAGVANFQPAFEPLLDLHRDTPTDQFQITDLDAVRQVLIDSKKYCRVTINGRMALIKQLFKWGVSKKQVPGSTWGELSAFRALPVGRGGVRDNPPVMAVPWAMVEKTVEHLPPTVRAAVMVQWWTGCRPAEVLAMTLRQLDTTGETWLYNVVRHKGRWRGKERVVVLGPKAQAEVKPFLTLSPDRSVFSPQNAWKERAEELRANRQIPETKQTRERDAKAAAAQPKHEFFDVATYRRAIWRACDKAGIPHWSPHKLRHAAGTRLAIKEGIETARAALGHTDARMTRRYAVGADTELAKQVMGRLG